MNYFEDVRKYFENRGLNSPVGCSAQEINELERNLGFKIPKAYEEYLSFMGKDYEGVMVGTNCFISDIKSNNEYLPKLLTENKLNSYELPKNYLAFFCHQGYMMAWFALPFESDDPICAYFFEGTNECPVNYGTFSEFMKKDILGNAKTRIALNRHERRYKKWWQVWK
jgi:hypothetical protein